jgi:hypothetical protein
MPCPAVFASNDAPISVTRKSRVAGVTITRDLVADAERATVPELATYVE